jgi:hypothetical protein
MQPTKDNDIFAEAHEDLEKVAARIRIWQQFLTDERRKWFEALGAEVTNAGKYDRFKTMHIACNDSPTVVHAAVEAMMIRPIHFRFERDSLFQQYGKTQPLKLTAFMDIPEVDEVPRLTVGVQKLEWTVSLSWFTLKHRVRRGERRGDLWFFPPEHSRIREPQRVEEFDFPEAAKRDEMFQFLFDKVEKKAVNVTFAKTLRERTAVLRAIQPLREDEAEWTLKG